MNPPSCGEIEVIESKVTYCRNLYNKTRIFRDRVEGGLALSELLKRLSVGVDLVVGLAAGGIPVAVAVSCTLGVKLDVVAVKKITFPWTTEAGYGAVDPDGRYIYDKHIAHEYLGLTHRDVEQQAAELAEYVRRRTLRLRGSLDYSSFSGARVLIVDDGIATGYTMAAALEFARRRGAAAVYAAAPTASRSGATMVSRHSDGVFVPNLRDEALYAVADAYIEWHDVSDEEALEWLRRGSTCDLGDGNQRTVGRRASEHLWV
ncbi:MAG: phosphoribosyltransferase family protein [Thermoproteota archaeon]